MKSRYAGGNRLRTGAEEILAAERNSFADRINEQRPPTDPLSAVAPLLRVQQVERPRSPHPGSFPNLAEEV